jgi:hypothetical protein
VSCDMRSGRVCLRQDHQYVDPGHCGICHEREPMKEVALAFDILGRPIHWMDGATDSSIPDSRSLWDVIWETRNELGGVAHTHPWDGKANPSQTDLTTFFAIERGLGKKLLWPVVTFTDVGYFTSNGYLYFVERKLPGATFKDFQDTVPYIRTAEWKNTLEELRRRSRNGG